MTRTSTLAEVTLSLGSFVVILLSAATGAHAQEIARQGAPGMHVRIETDRETYRVGEPISVQLTLQNRSAHKIEYVGGSPAGFADLVIHDASGRKVEPSLPPAWQIASGPFRTLMPQEEFRIGARGKGAWIDLKVWGYELRSPGKYTITRIPMVGGPNTEPNSKTVRSNEVTVTIEP
jgi:hypothetical protein